MMSKENLSNIIKVADGVYMRIGDIGRGQSNGGYIIFDDFVIAIEAPNLEATSEMFDEVRQITDKPIKALVITHGHWDHDLGVDGFTEKGISVICHENLRKRYAEQGKKGVFIGVTDRIALTNKNRTVEFFTSGVNHSVTDIYTYLPEEKIIFTGDSVVSMPATLWMGESDIWNWIRTLKFMKGLNLRYVCTGHGTLVGPEILDKLSTHLTNMKDEVGYQVSQGRSYDKTLENVKVATRYDWTPDDSQFKDQIKAVYDQLTSDPPKVMNRMELQALVLIGDHYHPPSYIPPALEPVFQKAGIKYNFIYDVTKLNAENLRGIKLLVILRDGMIWPENDKDMVFWMTEEQEKA
ncbi:MAG: MBL fold metallo-hydrolase, partial [Candidatus Poribacteria bacterium]